MGIEGENQMHISSAWVKVLTLVGLLAFGNISLGWAQPTLQEDWDEEIRLAWEGSGERNVPNLRGKRVLFVAGFRNEKSDSYFRYNRRVVAEEMGASIREVHLPSIGSVPENSERLRKIILEDYREYRRPILLFAHSKGASETLHFVLNHPDYVVGEGIVEKVFLLQSAIGGSPIAKGLLHLFPRFSPFGLKKGLEELVPEKVKSHWVTLFKEANRQPHFYASYDLLRDRVYFVRSYLTQKTNMVGINLGNRYLKRKGLSLQNRGLPHFDERNDGALLLEDQWMRGIGTDLGVIQAHHSEVVQGASDQKSDILNAEAFTRALFKRVYAKK